MTDNGICISKASVNHHNGNVYTLHLTKNVISCCNPTSLSFLRMTLILNSVHKSKRHFHVNLVLKICSCCRANWNASSCFVKQIFHTEVRKCLWYQGLPIGEYEVGSNLYHRNSNPFSKLCPRKAFCSIWIELGHHFCHISSNSWHLPTKDRKKQ